MYKHYKPQRKSRGSDVDSPDGNLSMEIDEDEEPGVDPKLMKDIDHLSKLERESGAAKVKLQALIGDQQGWGDYIEVQSITWVI